MTIQALHGTATRRDVITGALKTGAYAAPVIAAGVIPMTVGAVTAPTMMPVPAVGPLVFVAPTSGPQGTLFSVTGSGFPSRTALVARLIAGPVGANLGRGFAIGSSSATGTFFVRFGGGTSIGTFTYAVESADITNVLAQFALVVTTGTVPRIPVLNVSPASGPVGTEFAFNVGGLTTGRSYDIRLLSSPISNQSVTLYSIAIFNIFGQFAFGFNTSGTSANGAVGTYVLGIANAGSTTILAQATIVTTGITGQAIPHTESVPVIITTESSFTVGG